MSKTYYLKDENAVLGHFMENGDEIKYMANKEEADKLPRLIGYPPGLFMSTDPVGVEVGTDRVMKWAANRVSKRKRRHSNNHLLSPWEVVKKTRGMTAMDTYWVTEDPTLSYDEVREAWKNIFPRMTT